MKKLMLIAMLCLVGCSTPFYKNVEGESDSIGITLPDEEQIKIQVVNHLNGQCVKVMNPSVIVHSWNSSATNSYFGIIHVQEHREGQIEVHPIQTNRVDITMSN